MIQRENPAEPGTYLSYDESDEPRPDGKPVSARYVGVLAVIAVPAEEAVDRDQLFERVAADGLGENVQYLQVAPFTGSAEEMLADLAEHASLDPSSWYDPWEKPS